MYVVEDNLGSNSSVIQDNLGVERDNVQIKIIIKNIREQSLTLYRGIMS